MTKSKIVAFVAALALFGASTASAAFMFNMNLGFGMRNNDVKELQLRLNQEVGTNLPGTTYFGSLTRAAVIQYQTAKGISPKSGYVGPLTRAALNGSTPSTGTLPAGCTSTSGFSTTTGQPCNTGGSTTLPAGCTSTVGYSPITGVKCDSTTSGPQTGPVTVSLAATNPAPSTLVAGQATANLGEFTFMGNGTVTNVTLQRIGVSADSTLSNVYLFDGAMRLTDAASVSNNGMVSFNIPAGIFTVNGSKTISVRSDIASSTSGQTVGVKLVSFATASGTTTANISGNVHSIASATLATVSAGTITPSGATINPGANQTLWQSTLTVGQRDVTMKRFSLRNIGSAPASAFQNFKLFVNGVQVATAAGMDANGYVTFDMMSNPVTLVAGSRVVRVDADVVSGASRTVQLSVRSAADVDFVDSSYGVNIVPTSTPWSPSSNSTIAGASGGSLTIEKDTSSPSTNVVNNGTDVNLGTFKLTAFGEPVKIETIRATYASSDAAIGSLRNGRILINGVQYGSTATLNEDSQSTPYTSYTLNYTVYPGTPVMMELHADIYDNDGTDSITAGTDTLTGKIAVGSSNALRVDSLGYFNAPATAVSANTVTIASTAMTLSKDTTYTNQTVVLPQTNYKIGDWNLTGSSVEDILLTTLSFDVDEVTVSADDFNEDDITNMYAVVKDANGNTVYTASPIATVSATDNNFSLNYTLAKNSSVSIELYGNLGSTVTSAEKVKTDLTVTGTSLIGGSSVTATSADTDGQTLTAGSGSITATADASTPDSTKFADNQTVRSASFKFAAVNSGYKVTDITLTLPAAGATVVQTVTISSTTDSLSTSRAGAATVTFNGLDWDIPANVNAVLNVDLVLGTVGVNAGTSGASLLTTLTDATAVSSATGTSAAVTESNPAGNVHYAYAAVPSITMQTLPSTVLTNGTKTLAKFTVNTNGTGTIAWKEVLLDVSKPGGGTDGDSSTPTITSPTLWDADTNTQITAAVSIQNADGTSASTCAESDATCEILITVGAKSDDNVEKQISGSKTYEVRATVGGTLATGDYIYTVIPRNLSYAASAVFTSVDNDTTADDASFVWSDVSAQSHDTGTADWTNEALLMGLPTSTWTMTK